MESDWSDSNVVSFCEVSYSKELFQINWLFFILLMKTT